MAFEPCERFSTLWANWPVIKDVERKVNKSVNLDVFDGYNSLFPLVYSLSMDSSVIGVVEYFVALNEMLFNNIPNSWKWK